MSNCSSDNAITPSLIQKEAATKIQKVASGNLARIKLATQREVATRIQAVFRDLMAPTFRTPRDTLARLDGNCFNHIVSFLPLTDSITLATSGIHSSLARQTANERIQALIPNMKDYDWVCLQSLASNDGLAEATRQTANERLQAL